MSTRAHIIIRKSGQDDQFVYHHCDGYPEGVGAELDNVFSNTNFTDVNKAVQELENYNSQYRHNSYGIHGDEEYLYLVDLDAKTITCYEVLKYDYENASMSIMDAEHIEYVHNMSNGKSADETEAFADELRTKLHEGIVSFKYRKVNGDERTAVGTLKLDVLKKYNAMPTVTLQQSSNDCIRYYDLNSEGWRSCKIENLLEIF